MNCKVEKNKNANEIKLEITVESTRFDEAMQKVYFKSAKYFNIPGFRKRKSTNKYSRKNIMEKKFFMKMLLMI